MHLPKYYIMPEQVIHDTLLRELRRLNLYPPEERQLKDLRSKIEGKLTRDEINPSDPDFSKYTVLLYGLALKSLESDAETGVKESYSQEENDSATTICLDALAIMGHIGRTLAAKILCNKLFHLSQVKEWLEKKPHGIAISVADRIVATNPAEVPERLEFAKSIIAKAAMFDVADAASFFRKNGTRKGQLTFSTLENFMSGRYGKDCHKGLTEPNTIEEISICTESMPPYPKKELIKDVIFHLRTMDPIVMEQVLRAIERLADEIDDDMMKDIVPLSFSPSLPLAKAAMDIIAKFGNSRRGAIFAKIFNESPKIRAELINRLPILSSDNLSNFMSMISNGFHAPVISALYSTLAEEDPQCFGALLSQVVKSSSSPKKTRLKPELTKILQQDVLDKPERPEEIETRTVEGIDYIKSGAPIVLNIEKKNIQKGFKRIFGKETAQSDSMPDKYIDGQISNQRIHKLNRWKSHAKGITFQNCKFTACDFRSSFMTSCTFKNCTFESCTFGEASYMKCMFENSSFLGCSMNKTKFYNCTMKRCTFKYTHIDSAIISICSLELCEFTAVTAVWSYLYQTHILSSIFHLSDFRETFFYKGQLKGVIFTDSDLNGTLFSQTEVKCTTFNGCTNFDCKALCTRTNSTDILSAMQRTLVERLTMREQLKKRHSGFGNMGQYERGVIYKAVKRWFILKDIDRCYAKFSENNTRRLRWAASRMNSKCKIFLELLPALLHTNIFDQAANIEHLTVPSHISGYSLTLSTLKSFEQLFPDLQVESPKENAVPIEALMSIGSTGTIAQTASSDLDCWVCCDFSKCPTENREKLKIKLKAIEEWADKDFDLEIHFFVMDIEEIRHSRFGLSDEESSGSAQGAILKEEFYRTALLLAGKPPLWWFTPPEVDSDAYEKTARKLATLKGPEFAIDLGNIPKIPVEEFFGASLWQIVKGVKSPFKSIMKFGLLEMYTSGSSYTLLCEGIKENIIAGQRRLENVDPYMLLYSQLADFYTNHNKPEYTWLTAMALRLKCGILDDGNIDRKPNSPEELEIMEFTAGLSDENSPGRFKEFKGLTDFRSVVSLGKKINLFMIKTYMKVRGQQDKISGIAITPEDLTRLGRVIFASFAKRKFKVERVSLPGPRTHFFDSLLITRDSKQGWVITGEHPDESGSRVLQSQIESGKDLIPMLVWLALNGLYNSQMKTKTDLSSAPVRDRDLKKLFENLSLFFPLKKVFNTQVEESLNSEQLQKAYFIVNLCIGREVKEVKEVHLVYNTNWGEVFCMPMKITNSLIETPDVYLKEQFPEIYSGPVKMGQFVPQGSECKFIKIPVS
ncbi:class I adenylate cyclase [Maridesulfovibrio zosterae]|uniref:class I adenylate cyclase n=1 Tax=Maridesulfovibrio zosterae TaxID=82171 RepID=UPI00040FCC01|nr:class I adenylate cyclase [Maridesulfovibrio zosterae]